MLAPQERYSLINQALAGLILKLSQLDPAKIYNKVYKFDNLRESKENQISKKMLEVTNVESPLINNITLGQLKDLLPEELKSMPVTKDIFNLLDQLNFTLDQTSSLKEVPNLLECNLLLVNIYIKYNQQLKLKVGMVNVEPNFHLNEFCYGLNELVGLKQNNLIQLVPLALANNLKHYLQDYNPLLTQLTQALNGTFITDEPKDLLEVAKTFAKMLALETNNTSTEFTGIIYSAVKIINSKQEQLSLDPKVQSIISAYLTEQQLEQIPNLDQIIAMCSQIPNFKAQQLILIYRFVLTLQSLTQKLNLQSKCGQFKLMDPNMLLYNLPPAGVKKPLG